MKKIVILFLVCLISDVFGQTLEVKILGRINYEEIPSGYGIEIKFVENPNLCDPLIGFLNLNEQKENLIAEFKVQNIEFVELKDINRNSFSEYPELYCNIFEKDVGQFQKILEICKQNRVEFEEIYYQYEPHNLVMEDEKALLAYYNAEEKAKLIAKFLKKSKVRLLSIDDDTNDADGLKKFRKRHYTAEQLAITKLLNELLFGDSDNSMYGKKSKYEKKLKSYTIWAIFELQE